ncbi:MAG: glycosyltransferase family 2 protein [Pseudomonadota bacterium]
MMYADSPQARRLKARLQARSEDLDDLILLAPTGHVQELWAELLTPALLQFATTHLTTNRAKLSAVTTMLPSQAFWFGAVLLASVLCALIDLKVALIAANVGFGFIYLVLAVGRIVAVMNSGPTRPIRRLTIGKDALPRYTVLVAAYDEAAVMPQLICALSALQYPADKLDIMIVLEADDTETFAALRAVHLPDNMAVVRVPPSSPRTKPKALNFALPLARGEFVAVFDAEDRPEPDQLLKAVSTYHRHAQGRGMFPADTPLGCVQAALHVPEPGPSFFSRHFRLEYMGIFDALLPALARMNLPLPLGGTSNHFFKPALLEAGGWDPYNVTEDADLGIRLSRLGYGTEMMDSTTHEQAPATFGPWVRQRARWFKGWWQTWLVHMRSPRELLRELGLSGFVCFQLIVLGVLLSMLLHPIFLFLVLYSLPTLPIGEGFGVATSLAGLNMANLVLGYAAAAALCWAGADKRGDRGTWRSLCEIPVYWVFLFFAGVLALWDLVRRPHHWHKTPHSADTHRVIRGSEELERVKGIEPSS